MTGKKEAKHTALSAGRATKGKRHAQTIKYNVIILKMVTQT